ncbi:MAG TPA: tRNA dihydrouridine(20/20a) synthase DusA [Burkholderiaceae bacterium]|nr:tRNA dihydrouridine(20/20a) synthase DusA [Burkholderiaceae bacterium]
MPIEEGSGQKQRNPWRLCVAPMLDWTDRHCRSLHRLLSPHARLYSEMVTTGALLHGDRARHLDFDPGEHPLALQLGGSDPEELAQCARLGQAWGYDEINLNCGCPSERVQRGSFGACLMVEPRLVADCVRAMKEAVSIPVTIKHRIGIDRDEDYALLRDFVGHSFDAGCRVFLVHARNAWLHGLSPKENREVPPLRYDVVQQLKRDFADATVVLNGGLRTPAHISRAMQQLDGVMLGRIAYQQPYFLAILEKDLFGRALPANGPSAWVEPASRYLERAVAQGATPWSVIRHTLGLFHGCPGARTWRQRLSNSQFVAEHGVNALRVAAADLMLRAEPSPVAVANA